MKIALVHDDFIQQGGAEILFAKIAQMFPKAPIFTSLVNWNKVPSSIAKERIKVSWMQKIPLSNFIYKLLLPIYPLAFEGFNFDKYDVVISSTTRFAKSVITKPATVHICYINSTPRFLWNENSLRQYLPKYIIYLFKPLLNWLRLFDKVSSSRVDQYIANSKNIANQISKIYKTSSYIIYPFADTNYFKVAKIHKWNLKNQKYYLIVSRLVKWKKIELALNVAKLLNINLKIVGEGPDKSRLKSIAGENAEFLNKVNREKLKELYQNCQALIVTQQEDFGIAAVEAQSCGRPVIAYSRGGVSEIVVNNKTGVFFNNQNENSLKDALNTSTAIKWNTRVIRKNALKFSAKLFEKKFTEFINNYADKSPGS